MVGVEAVTVNGEVVSSTAIRKAVADGESRQGDGDARARIHDPRHGDAPEKSSDANLDSPRRISARTANSFRRTEFTSPKATRWRALHRGVANLGYRPTVTAGKPERLLELHLFDLDEDIYGEEIEVRFLRYLRPEQKFENLEALKAQIARDVEQARESYGGSSAPTTGSKLPQTAPRLRERHGQAAGHD